MAPYSDMVKFAEHYKLPQHFTDDLYKHDLQALTEYGPNKPFVWVLRNCGTHFYRLDNVDFRDVKRFICMLSTFGDSQKWYVLWNGNNWESGATQNIEKFLEMTEAYLNRVKEI